MLIRGPSTEDRISEIANKFAQGIGQYAQSQQQTAQTIQQEAQRRQDALQREELLRQNQNKNAFDVAATLSERTGRIISPADVAPALKSGDFTSLGSLLKSAPLTPKQERQNRLDVMDEQLKLSQISKNNRAGNTAIKPTIAEQSVDRGFAKTYDDFIVGGGYTKVAKGLADLKSVSNKLGKEGADITGPLTGRTPEWIQSFTNPKALQYKDRVGSVIQDNLKAILGASYTEKEGERVIERAYNPKLSESENKRKIDALIGQMENAAKAKVEAAKYFEQNGTMKGYKGTQINSVDDIFKAPSSVSNEIVPINSPQDLMKADRQSLLQKARELAAQGG